MASGLAAIPILFAKLWSAMPKLFEWPPVRSLAHMIDRALAGAAGRRQPLRLLHGHPQHPALLPLEVQLRPRPLLRGLHLPRGARPAPGDEDPGRAAGVPRARRLHAAQGRPRAHRSRSRTSEETTAPWIRRAPTMSRRGLIAMVGAGIARARRDGGRPVDRRSVPQAGLPRAPRQQRERWAERLPDQPYFRGGRDRPQGRGGRLATEARGGTGARALAGGAAGDAPADLLAADRLRRGLVDDAELDRACASATSPSSPERRPRASC